MARTGKLKTLASSRRRDNSWLAAKRALRVWAVGALGHVPASAYEVFGSGGASTRWLQSAGCSRVDGCTGEAIAGLKALDWWGYDWFDVDPYGNPWAALHVVGQRAIAPRIALFVCDGCMTAAGKLRFHWPPTVRDVMGWPDDDVTRKAWVWYHYPAAFREVLAKCMGARWLVEDTRSAPLGTRRGTIVRYSAAILNQTSI